MKIEDALFYERYMWYMVATGMPIIPILISTGLIVEWFWIEYLGSSEINPLKSDLSIPIWATIAAASGPILILLGIGFFFSVDWNALRNDVRLSL